MTTPFTRRREQCLTQLAHISAAVYQLTELLKRITDVRAEFAWDETWHSDIANAHRALEKAVMQVTRGAVL